MAFKNITKDQLPISQKCLFHEIAIDDIFHIGYDQGKGIKNGFYSYLILKKISVSKALIIDTPGYSNNRFIGDIKEFNRLSIVFKF